jgi:hypothetical protein
VRLVDPRRMKHVPGRKTDVLDCQWIQQLHSFGLLDGAFRPSDQIVVLQASCANAPCSSAPAPSTSSTSTSPSSR